MRMRTFTYSFARFLYNSLILLSKIYLCAGLLCFAFYLVLKPEKHKLFSICIHLAAFCYFVTNKIILKYYVKKKV